jgi:hypothetical protein
MLQTTIPDADGTVHTYGGHDELSTAYGFPSPPTGQIPIYQGKFMADDFADNITDDVLHVKWWGSYIKDFIHPQMPVNKFLISFESDIPAGPAPSFSKPGQPLLNQVVTKGPLSPGSGTYTETLVRGPDTILNESVYEYNAELAVPFPESKDTVYWLKIVALVDVPAGLQFDPYQPQFSPVDVTQWGWHNRDYTMQNLLASPNVAPGEFVEGVVGAGTQVWHFQDDAIEGDVRITPNAAGGFQFPNIFQPPDNMVPQLYRNFTDGPGMAIPGTVPIGQLSKDLAFSIYTHSIPEPSSCMLIGLAMALVGIVQPRSR